MPFDDPWVVHDYVQPAAFVETFRLLPDSTVQALPNVECISVRIGEGPDPGNALFRYNLNYQGPGGARPDQ